ncbi:hypothetical protein PVAG01_07705 [Phlyctema vagabunda]|uniref:Uncharacterized protein n=1 Tax=Phlyctema vagabunda TaxID=108571 RepID=A0ABR4PD65_9HELO
MESKKTMPAAEAKRLLSMADKQIDAIIQSHLPPSPHLLSVPTDNPYRPNFPFENTNTSAAHLFESWELKKLQYMTLVSHGDRGVGLAQGNWEDEVNPPSPQSLGLTSSTPTPNPHKQAKVKLSVADYKKVRNGEMAMPKASASPPETKKPGERKLAHGPNPGHLHPNSHATARLAADDKRNGTVPASLPKKPEQNLTSRDNNGNPPPRSGRPESKDTIPRVNGVIEHSRNESSKSKDNTPARPSPRIDSVQKSREAPKLTSSSRSSTSIWDTKSNKRSLEVSSRETSNPEKRAKIDGGQLRTPSSSRIMPSNKTAEAKPPFRPGHSRSTSNLSHVSPSQASQPQKKAAPTSHPADKKSQLSKNASGKPPNSLPPLLSPLPTGIGISSTGGSGFGFLETSNSDDHPTPRTPKRGTGAESKSKHDSPLSSPLTTPPKSQSSRDLPPPLSPTLPDILEQELAKRQQKSAMQSQSIPDKAAEPKAAKAKVGHPPKQDRRPEPSNSRAGDEGPHKVVKLRYKKKYSRDIERILAFKSAPSKEFKALEAQRLAAERVARQPATQPKFDEDSSEEDIPLVNSKPSLARKRPMESAGAAPATAPGTASKGHGGAPQKNLLLTPKKGDAMKSAISSVAMRKVESSDGHARTPQAATISTPASTEKPRVTNGDTRPEYDKLALKLKRKMDAILKTKEPPAMRNVSDSQNKLGLCVGLECIAAYMLNASYMGRAESSAGRPRQSVHWEQVIALWGFIDHQCHGRTQLHALSTQIGAVCYKQLLSIYIETNDAKAQGTYRKTEAQLYAAKSRQNELPGYGKYPEITGLDFCSTVSEATGLTYAALERFNEAEKNVKWRREG